MECAELVISSSTNLLINYLLGTSWLANPRIGSELYIHGAQKSLCRPDYNNDITTTLPNTDTLLSVEAKNTKKKKKYKVSIIL